MESDHIIFMQRCLELASLGLGKVAPNPMVGSILVHDGRIIGEGYHKAFGYAHAEVNAVSSVKTEDKPLIRKCTLYVNLEPCKHHGQTPPCTDMIIKEQIPNVVIAVADPNEQVKEAGAKHLEAAGVKLIQGVLEAEARHLNRRFFTFHSKHRPYLILKWAETQDGFMAPDTPVRKWISNDLSMKLTHKWRSEEMAILVGTNTAEIDDPKLTVRDWEGENPLRLVLDQKLRLSSKLNLFDQSTPTVIFNDKIDKKETNLEWIRIDFKKEIISQVLSHLMEKNIQSLIVEGGAKLLDSFIASSLWDEARFFVGTGRFEKGVRAPKPQAVVVSKEMIGDNELTILAAEQG